MQVPNQLCVLLKMVKHGKYKNTTMEYNNGCQGTSNKNISLGLGSWKQKTRNNHSNNVAAIWLVGDYEALPSSTVLLKEANNVIIEATLWIDERDTEKNVIDHPHNSGLE